MKDVKEPRETRGGRRPRLATTWRRSTVRTSGITKNWKIPTNFFLCIDYYFVFCVGLEIMQKINLENFVFQFYVVTFS